MVLHDALACGRVVAGRMHHTALAAPANDSSVPPPDFGTGWKRCASAAPRIVGRLTKRRDSIDIDPGIGSLEGESRKMSDSPRVAVVTGSARGIGAATAQRLAAEGFAVAVLDLEVPAAKTTVDAIESCGGRALAVGADVSDPDQVSAAVDRISTELGAPTVLVNNAGVTRDNLLFKMTLDDWGSVVNVHLPGSFLMTKAVQKYMVDARFGRIVNISSTSALGNRGQSNYSTEGRPAGLHQDARHRARQVRCDRELHRARLHRQ